MTNPTGRVIEGDVKAGAGDAQVAIRRTPESIPDGPVLPPLPAVFYYREQPHNRVTPVREGDQIALNSHTLVERITEGGTWPDGVARFQGVGQVNAETPRGQINRQYRFDIPAHTLDEAWANFDAAAQRGSALAIQQMRAEVAQMMRGPGAGGGLVVPGPGAAARILGADGRPAL